MLKHLSGPPAAAGKRKLSTTYKRFETMAKAVALLSGGLDSTLAVKMMLDQGVEVVALNFTSAFCTCNSGGKSEGGGCKSESRRVAEEFGVPIKVLVKGLDYMEVVRNPRFGYGKGINPCVDCRMYMFKAAKEYMEEIGASFIITGEVLGQRPMSQRRDVFRKLERECGLEGLILRPLSAHLLEPTIPEKEGLVDREKLLSVAGRSRKVQMEKADELDVADYPCPSGGCLLTDKIFSKKVRDLIDHKKELTATDLALLKAGRHFRYHDAKVVVGRSEADNERIRSLVQPGDTLVEPVDFPGPVALVSGGAENGSREFASGLIIRYSKKAPAGAVLKAVTDDVAEEFPAGGPVPEELADETRVC